MENGKVPAFTGIVNEAYQSGLSKREYFAGLAMQGLLVSNHDADFKEIAEWSVKMADELLKQLGDE